MARPARRVGNLPAETTSFVGRRSELAEVRKKLTEARLVSLVGPGGVGKTRLSVRAAAGLGRGFRGGAWLAELAEVGDPDLVSSAILAALDLRDQAATEPLALLLSYLRDKELLLVLDNCEHVLDAAARVVADLLRAAPGVRVIATSREPLSVAGEHVIPVPPLGLPPTDLPVPPAPAGPLAALRGSEAVMLFTERAAAASGTFELTAANQVAVAELCRRLDGLPLAIELAAVRTRVLAVEQILGRLADRFSLLTGGSRGALPRHQTLRTTIEWSHDLLSARERAVLRRCCVFAGRFTLDDVEEVCSSPAGEPAGDALDLLSSLVGKSLVMKEDAGGIACYRLHETMREFAGLKLREAGEEESAGLRCAEHYHATCQRSALEGRYRLVGWLAWADLEIDNVRAVMQRCLGRGDTARGVDLAASLGWYWITRATSEGIRWLDAFLASEDIGNTEGRGWAYFMRGFLAVLKADPGGARPALAAAVTVARETGQGELLCEALSISAVAADMAGEHTAAGLLIGEADVVASGVRHYPAGAVAVLQARALHGFFAGDLAAARAAATEGARRARETGDCYAQEMMLLNLGSVALNAGDLDGARPLLAEALRLAHQIDDRVAQFYLLDAFGCHAALSRQPRRAAQLLGAADTVRAEAGANVMPFLAPLLARSRESAVAALGAARFQAGFEAGQRLDRDGGLRLALGEPAAGRPGGPGGGAPAAAAAPGRAAAPARVAVPAAAVAAVAGGAGGGLLGKREADVARLVADGLTNKQIGARLFISERTVDSHVRNILNKLGVGSRAQIATWIATLGE
jgi:predicted ATPase/DNA-binding CsgD family transcriptional regulator